MSLGDITIDLNLDGKDFSIEIKKADQLIQQFKKSIKDTDGGIKKHQSSLYKWGRSLRDTALTLGALPFAIHSLNQAFDSTIGYVIKANAKLERLNALMLGLSNTSTTMAGAQQEANNQMEFLFALAQKTPFSIDALTDSMVKFKSVGLDPMDGKMEALIDSVAKFGGTSQHLHRASIAIQQMVGKGVVSMEELRQQLGEAVPDAMVKMAKGMGITTAELTRQVSKGIVEAKSAIKSMTNQMAIENMGAAERMANTWDGIIGRMSSKWLLLMKEVGDQGGFKELKESLNEILDGMDDPTIVKFFKDFGSGAASAIRGTKELIRWLSDHVELIKVAGIALASYKIYNSDIARLLEGALANGYKKANAAISSYSSNISELSEKSRRLAVESRLNAEYTKRTGIALKNAATEVDAYAAKQAVTTARIQAASGAMSAFATATKRAGMFLATSLGPMVALTGAIWAISKALGNAAENQATFNRALVEGENAYDMASLTKYEEQLESLQKRRNKLRSNINTTGHKFSNEDRAGFAAEIRKIDDEMLRLRENIEVSTKDIFSRIGDKAFETVARSLQDELGGVILSTSAKLTELHEQYTNSQETGVTQEIYNERYAKLLENHKAELNAIWERRKLKAEERVEDILSGKSREELDKKQLLMLVRQEAIIRKIAEKKKEVNSLEGINPINLVTNAEGGKVKDFEAYFQRIEDRLSGVREKAAGGSTELGKFNNQLKRNAFGNKVKEEDIEEVRKMLKEIDSYNTKVKIQTEATDILSSAQDQLRTQYSRVKVEMEALGESENTWLKQTTGARQLGKTITQVQEKLKSLGNSSQTEKLNKQISELIDLQAKIDLSQDLKSMNSKTKELTRSLMTQEQQTVALYNEEMKRVEAWYLLQETANGTNTAVTMAYEKYKSAMNEKLIRDTEKGASKVLREWSDTSETMDRVWSRAMNGMSDSLTDFLLKGKGNFSSFLTDIAYMIVRANLNKLIASSVSGGSSGGIFGTILSAGLSMFGGSSAVPAKTGAAAISGQNLHFKENGGIVGNKGEAVLRKYKNGGIANSPQYAVFGEGTMPEAYVPLPDGRTIPVTMAGGGGSSVEVNVINQSGTQVDAENRGQRFDGEKMILDVVLKAATKPGKFKNGLKGAMRT